MQDILNSSRFQVSNSFFGQTWAAWGLFFVVMVATLSFATAFAEFARRRA